MARADPRWHRSPGAEGRESMTAFEYASMARRQWDVYIDLISIYFNVNGNSPKWSPTLYLYLFSTLRSFSNGTRAEVTTQYLGGQIQVWGVFVWPIFYLFKKIKSNFFWLTWNSPVFLSPHYFQYFPVHFRPSCILPGLWRHLISEPLFRECILSNKNSTGLWKK